MCLYKYYQNKLKRSTAAPFSISIRLLFLTELLQQIQTEKSDLD